jgi:hypothetical protein
MTSPLGPVCPAAAGPDGAEDAGANDGADGEHDQIAGAEHTFQGMRTVRWLEFGDGLAG